MFLLGLILISTSFSITESLEALEGRIASETKCLNTTDDVLKWKAPIHIRKQFPYYLSGYDYEKTPVLEWGRWDPHLIVEENGEDLQHLNKYVEQFLERIRTSFYRTVLNDSDITTDQIVAIIDYDGLDLRQARSPANVKFFIELSAKVEKVFEHFDYGIVVNANPLVHQLIQLSKPFMANFLERMDVYGTNPRFYIPQILKKISRDQLHPAYGGLKNFLPVAVYG